MAEHKLLDQTPTWVFATVFIAMITVGIFLVKFIRLLMKCLKRIGRIALRRVVRNIKDELMVLGTFSLCLHFIQRYKVAMMCTRGSILKKMLPCDPRGFPPENEHSNCAEGLEPLMTAEAADQIHIFIFLLAVSHVSNTTSVIMLAKLKVLGWRSWERNRLIGPLQVKFTNQEPGFKAKMIFYGRCFLRHLWRSVDKEDYETLRRGYITDDFIVVAKVKFFSWVLATCLLLLNVSGYLTLFWTAHIPFINTFQMTYFLWVLIEFGGVSCLIDLLYLTIYKILVGIIAMILCSYHTLPLYALVSQVSRSRHVESHV